MERLKDKINRFLAVSYGDGSGDGSGYGYDSGSGDGSGSGSGYGDGYGYGSGYGDGDGYGYDSGSGDGSGYDGSGYDDSGYKSLNGHRVYYIDDMPTIIYDVIGNNARCAVVQSDLTLKPCYVAKVYNFFAHGNNLHDAMEAAQGKYEENKPLKERIFDFITKYPTLDTVATNKDLFVAHHTLTGSCLFGRQQFVKEHSVDVEHGSMKISEFIELTSNAYGKEAILRLKESYKQQKS